MIDWLDITQVKPNEQEIVLVTDGKNLTLVRYQMGKFEFIAKIKGVEKFYVTHWYSFMDVINSIKSLK